MAWRSQGRDDIQVDVGSAERRAAQREEKAKSMREQLAAGLRSSRISFAEELAECADEESDVAAARRFGASQLERILDDAGRQEREARKGRR